MKINEVRQLDELNPFKFFKGKADDVAKVAEPPPIPNVNWKGKGEYAGLSYDAKNKVVTLPNGNKVPVAGPDEAKKVADDYLKAQGKTPPPPKQKNDSKNDSGKSPGKGAAIASSTLESARIAITAYIVGREFADAYIYYAARGFSFKDMSDADVAQFFIKLGFLILIQAWGVKKVTDLLGKAIPKSTAAEIGKMAEQATWKSFLKTVSKNSLLTIPPGVVGFATMPKEVWAEFERSIGLE